MLTVCICDDDKRVLDKLSPVVQAILTDYPTQLISLESGESFLFHFLENPNLVDIILMDIDMGELNGIEVMTKMRAAGCMSELIYLTAMRDYVFDSFDTRPLNYILKEDLYIKKLRPVLLTAARNALKKKNNFILIGSSKNTVKVNRIHILYMEVVNRQVVFHVLDNPAIKTSCSLLQALDLVENEAAWGEGDFVQIHKSYIVNLNNIRQLKVSSIILIDGTELPIGRKFINDVRNRFSLFLSRNTIITS